MAAEATGKAGGVALASPLEFDTKPLELLLKAPSKKMVEMVFEEVFKNRRGPVSEPLASGLESALKATRAEALALVQSLRGLINIAVYENSAALEPLFPSGFHEALQGLLLSVVDARLAAWRVAAQESQVSLPKMQSVDWRIDVKRASDSVASMSVPTVLVTLEVEDKAAASGTRTVTFEMSKQSLSTMIDGMEKIKEQLGSLGGGAAAAAAAGGASA